MRLPIRTRLTLVFAALSALVVGIAAAALVIGFRAELARTVDDGLRARLVSFAADPTAAVDAAAGAEDSFAQYVDPDGTLVTSSGLTEPLLPATLTDGLRGARFFDREVRTAEEEVPARLLASPVAGGGVLVLGVDVEDQQDAIARLTALVAVGGPILLAALAAPRMVARRCRAPAGRAAPRRGVLRSRSPSRPVDCRFPRRETSSSGSPRR